MKSLLKFIPMYFIMLSSFLCADTQDVKDTEIIKPDETISIEDAFGYVSIGIEPISGFHVLGLGYKLQKNRHGLDVSTSSMSGNFDYESYFEKLKYSKRKTNLLYNFFFSPDLNSQVYLGLGLGINYIGIEDIGFIVGFSPELVIGKQYNSRKNNPRFIQIQISLPGAYIKSKENESHPDYISKIKSNAQSLPLFIFFYGIGF